MKFSIDRGYLFPDTFSSDWLIRSRTHRLVTGIHGHDIGYFDFIGNRLMCWPMKSKYDCSIVICFEI